VAVALAVGLASQREVDELLDDSLHATAQILAGLFALAPAVGSQPDPQSIGGEFAWQVLDGNGAVVAHAGAASVTPLRQGQVVGHSSTDAWRIYGLTLGGASSGQTLYVAHTQSERREARRQVVLSAVLSTLAIGLLGHWWLRRRVAAELRPLDRLSARLEQHDPFHASHTLGPPERLELEPVHAAIDTLGRRLGQRVAHERAVVAHAAHALRTPLAGMEAQLAVAMRESPEPVQARLRRVREASGRLQRVVRSLLELFRAGGDTHRGTVDVRRLCEGLPMDSLEVQVDPACHVLDADPDLLSAALANLLDNAARYGATQVWVDTPRANTVRLRDNGPGVSEERRGLLQQALAAQQYESAMGLGLMLADLIARAHEGSLVLPAPTVQGQGFVVELRCGARPNPAKVI
jgi:signal transduction histidine kinase